MAVLVVHCGAHSTDTVLDAATSALDEGLAVLRAGGDAMDAAVRAVVVLEDDERTNAGTGSRLNLAGQVEMDASVMDSRGEAGAVGAVSGVRNPILVARAVLDSPHVILAGNGATQFAREAGFPEYEAITEGAQQALRRAKAAMERSETPMTRREAHEGDTVGAVGRDDTGYMAAANSTGGISVQLPGRLGDTPVIGAGIYAGSAGAVTSTGIGEEIIRAVLAKDVYDLIAGGMAPQEACHDGVRRFDAELPVGLLAVSDREAGAASNTRMAWRSGEV